MILINNFFVSELTKKKKKNIVDLLHYILLIKTYLLKTT